MSLATLCLIFLSPHTPPPAIIAQTNSGSTNAPVSQIAQGITPRRVAGEPAGKYTVSQLTGLLVQKQYLELDAALKGGPNIPAVSRAFLEGVLANRENRITDSLRELELALADTAAPPAPNLLNIALDALADDYMKSYRYGDAADAYARLLARKDSSLTDAERKDIEGSRQTMELLRSAPSQTMVFHTAFTIPTKKNALGLAEAQGTAGGRHQSWILDTGANMSLVTASEARRMELTPSQGTTPLMGVAGGLVSAHTAVIPELQMGTATFRHVPVLVVEDKDFYIPEAKFQFYAILGYPMLSALGSITLHSNGGFGARNPPRSNKLRGSQMMMEELAPLVVVTIGKDRRLFLLDTGMSRTYLTERYWQEHKSEFPGQPTRNMGIGGAGGHITVPAYTARRVAITAGGVHLMLKDAAILTKPTGTNADYFYGVLGQDTLNLFTSCTLDFRNMRYICAKDTTAPRKSDDKEDDDD